MKGRFSSSGAGFSGFSTAVGHEIDPDEALAAWIPILAQRAREAFVL